MKRRTLLKQVTTGSIAGAAVAACSVSSTSKPSLERYLADQPVVNWRMTTSWPRFLNVFEGVDVLCRQVSDMTFGRFTITPYEGGDLVPPLDLFDAVQEGQVECGHTALYYFLDKSPALALGTSVPFGLTAQQQNAWLYSGGGIEAIQKVLDPFGLVWFPAGNTTGQMGGWFRQQVNTVADLQGLKMRIPGLGGQVLTRLGVTIENLAAQDIVPALLEGTIDAVEWIGPSDDRTLGLQKAAPYYYYPGWWEPGTSFATLVNQKQWDALPVAYQAVFKTAAAEANLATLALYNAKNGEALERFRLGGTTTLPFSESILQTCRDTAFEIYQEIAAEDEEFERIYREWQVFRDRIYDWNRISSLSFGQFAFENTQQEAT